MKSILLIAANPKNITNRRLQEEERDIKECLRHSEHREMTRLSTSVAARPRDIQRALLYYKPQVVHFSGRGAGQAGLYFEDLMGTEKLVSTEALADLFRLFSHQVECVVLNACYSEWQAKIISQHIDHVIGMNRSIGNSAAIKFVNGFYTALSYDESFKLAYELGCNAIQLEGIQGHSAPTFFEHGIKYIYAFPKESNCSDSENDQNNNCHESQSINLSFHKLSQYLKLKQWEAADQETSYLLMHSINAHRERCLKVEHLKTIPCGVLKKIDQLWLTHSHHKFGFSVQSRIWQQQFKGIVNISTEMYLGHHLGWREDNSWKDYEKVTFNLNKACRGHFPCFFLSPQCWRHNAFLPSLMKRFVDCNP